RPALLSLRSAGALGWRSGVLLEESEAPRGAVAAEAVAALALDPGEAGAADLLLLAGHAVHEEAQGVAVEQRVVAGGEEEDRDAAQAGDDGLCEADDPVRAVPERRGRAGGGGGAGDEGPTARREGERAGGSGALADEVDALRVDAVRGGLRGDELPDERFALRQQPRADVVVARWRLGRDGHEQTQGGRAGLRRE